MPTIVYEWFETTDDNRDCFRGMCRVVENDHGMLLTERSSRKDAMGKDVWEPVFPGPASSRMLSIAIYKMKKA